MCMARTRNDKLHSNALWNNLVSEIWPGKKFSFLTNKSCLKELQLQSMTHPMVSAQFCRCQVFPAIKADKYTGFPDPVVPFPRWVVAPGSGSSPKTRNTWREVW